MSEEDVRRIVAEHAELTRRVEEIVKDDEARRLLAVDDWRSNDAYDPEDEDLKVVAVEDDRIVLRFMTGDYDNRHAAELSIPLDYFLASDLERGAILGSLRAAREVRWTEEAAREKAKTEAEDRARYELLRRKFEPSELRADIKRAIEVEARIQREDAP